MYAHGEGEWGRFVKPWRALEIRCRSGFLPRARKEWSEPDKQALEFVNFAEGTAGFRRIWVWSLCRDFAERYPRSNLLPEADATRQKLEAEFVRRERQVVIHGHIAVLEPAPRSQGPTSDMIDMGAGSLTERVTQQPSNWSHHREAVEYCKDNNVITERYWYFTQLARKYPGNEWVFLADAAYQQRVRNRMRLGLECADKALILNPENPKAYAIRGMIRIAAGKSTDEALGDLNKAFELDSQSLGDEPETPRAVFFLVEQTLKAGDKAAARKYLEALGGLKAFRAEQPLKETAKFKELVGRVKD